jgi:tetratricopeptide (TPR) repeat protein
MSHSSNRSMLGVGLAVCLMAGPVVSASPTGTAKSLNDEGMQALIAGKPAAALEKFRAAARLKPDDLNIVFNLGLCYFRIGRYEAAEPPLRRALASPVAAEQSRYLLGASLYERGEYRKASEQLERSRGSKYAEGALYMLEESYRRSGKPELAKQAFTELAARFPDSAQLHKLLGVAYDEQGEKDQALSEFELALKADERLPEIRFAIGFLHFQKHDEARARKWLGAELQVSPCYAAAFYYLGELDREAERLAEAGAAYSAAIRCKPAYADAHLGLGMVLEKQGRILEALGHFHESVRLNPNRYQAHFQLAETLKRAGLGQQAKTEFEKVRELAVGEDARARGDSGQTNSGQKLNSLMR